MILGSLQLKLLWPPYASNLIFEVWRDSTDSEAYVRVLFNGQVMKLPGCGLRELCPLEAYVEFMQKNCLLHDPSRCWIAE
jgi:hypothetical protein